VLRRELTTKWVGHHRLRRNESCTDHTQLERCRHTNKKPLVKHTFLFQRSRYIPLLRIVARSYRSEKSSTLFDRSQFAMLDVAWCSSLWRVHCFPLYPPDCRSRYRYSNTRKYIETNFCTSIIVCFFVFFVNLFFLAQIHYHRNSFLSFCFLFFLFFLFFFVFFFCFLFLFSVFVFCFCFVVFVLLFCFKFGKCPLPILGGGLGGGGGNAARAAAVAMRQGRRRRPSLMSQQ
jgi:hypothetical protein